MSSDTLLGISNQMADAAAAAAPSVVQVHGRGRPASGIVFAPGHVLTTSRALGQEDGLHVRAEDGRAVVAQLAGWDPATSLVVLRAPDLAAPVAAVSDVAPRVGHLALGIARSWSNALTASAGIISVIGGPLPTGRGRAIDRVIRTTAPMHGGFAGGGFVDVAGRFIGIATAEAIRGLGVVIPAEIAWKKAAALAEHGTVKRGYLGIAGQPVRLPERQREAEDRTHALLVAGVSAGSPAEAGGILIGDVVLSFDNQPIQSPVDLLELLQGDRVGRAVPIRVLRGGSPIDLSVTVGDRPAQ